MARKLLITLAGTLVAAAIGAAPASAVPCSGLQTALDDSDPGETVALDAGALCGGATYTLPSHQIVLDGNGAIFDGGGVRRLLVGDDVGATTIREATFRNGSAGEDGGGAVRLTGASAPTIEDAVFADNESDGPGGAVYLESDPFSPDERVNGAATEIQFLGTRFTGNQAGGFGGAVYGEILFTTTRIEDSEFDDNRAVGSGGGAALIVCGFADLVANAFTNNTAQGAVPVEVPGTNGEPVGEARGGGLYLFAGNCAARGTNGDGRPSVQQEDNLFEANTADGRSTEGGGEWLRTDHLLSTGDVFHDNAGTGEGSGGGLKAEAGTLTALNFVATANGVDGEGGGLDVASEGGTTALEIVHGTIAGNTGPGVNGDLNDSLTLHNSIVSGNGTGEQVSGFGGVAPRTNGAAGSRDVRFTLLCEGTAAAAGPGNLCADPELAGVPGGDVHQTAASPTLDKGSQPLSSFLASDYEGDDRTIDANGDGDAAPDMGADEAEAEEEPTPSPPAPQPQPQPQPPAPPAGGVRGDQARSCVSRRSFRIRLRNRGQKVVKATVIVNGKRVKVLRGKRLTSRVNLRGLPKGRFTVRIKLELANGKTISGVRRYRTCTKARPGGVPPV